MEQEKLSKREVAERRDDALRRALSTPPKPKQESVKPHSEKSPPVPKSSRRK